MKRFVGLCWLVCLFVCMGGLANAATYYVDATGGSDTNSGTSAAAPWQTLAQVNSTNFLPGDTILFLKGQVWREQLAARRSGTAGNPVTYGAYGTTGANPVISGADLINPASWTLYSGHIYVANVALTPGSNQYPLQLYVDGVYHEIARYPANSYLLTTAASPDQFTVIDSTLALSASDIVGSTLVARSAAWATTQIPVTAFNASTGTVTTGTNTLGQHIRYQMGSGWGFYFRNMLWMLQTPGQWFYDSSAGKLYLWTLAGDNPAAHTVEVSVRPYSILINNPSIITQDYIGFSNITVTYSQDTNIQTIHADTGLTLDHMTSIGGVVGMNLNCTNCSVQNNVVEGGLNNGINLYGDNSVIANNTIDNAGNVALVPDSTPTSLSASSKSGVANTMSGNNVTNNGYAGIMYGGPVFITNNTVDQSCLKLDDCAGIYGGILATISGNTVTNSIGNVAGTPTTSTQAEGIYLDNNNHDNVVVNNYVSNVNHGVYIHDGYNDTVLSNRIFDARVSGLWIKNDYQAGYVYNNTVMGNVFETLGLTGSETNLPAVIFNDYVEATANFGTYNYNLYCHPRDVVAPVFQSTTAGNLYYNLNAWQQASGQDLQSTDSPSACPGAVPPSIAPTISFSASPTTVAYNGTTSLTWSAVLATSCTASGGWSGAQSVSGAVTTAALTGTTTYTLACTGIGGTTTQSVTVIVVPPPAPTVSLVASPSSIANGATTSLTWSSTNASTCTASGGWSGGQSLSGTVTTAALTGTTSYTLACTGIGGTATQSSTVIVSTAAPTVSLAASPSSIAYGATATLTWSSANASSCTASGGWSGAQATSGTIKTGALTGTTTYGLTCVGAGGTASQSATVNVAAPLPPVVNLQSTAYTVTSRGTVTLTWSAVNASSCMASGNWIGDVALSGSFASPPLVSLSNYTLSCTGAGGTTTKSVNISIKGERLKASRRAISVPTTGRHR